MWKCKTPGIPDELFLQSDKVPGPTKEEIRVVTISKARLREGAYVLDVGCGTGGLTVEAALQVGYKGKVFAVDEEEEAVKLTRSNVEKFDAQDIVQIIHGKAPDAILNLPKLDAVMIGGSKNLREVMKVSFEKLKKEGRMVINAILLETATTALDEIKKLNAKDIDVTSLSIAKGKDIGSGTMMLARNPITIVSATKA
ncbi:MAG TPA: precorrin-6Y C5,15-methyltransferase (decarboxylating) subunit CbiT [Candidatus Bathyarchaeia archaeon]|nr:precorrin-6Y C5,15-methyltransferase (decarboxylating) subunit CbiT [Candidatus Bathyarchaeia archaeon]